jgi:hypothetical protein
MRCGVRQLITTAPLPGRVQIDPQSESKQTQQSCPIIIARDLRLRLPPHRLFELDQITKFSTIANRSNLSFLGCRDNPRDSSPQTASIAIGVSPTSVVHENRPTRRHPSLPFRSPNFAINQRGCVPATTMAMAASDEQYFVFENRLASFRGPHPVSGSGASSRAPKTLQWPHKSLSPVAVSRRSLELKSEPS